MYRYDPPDEYEWPVDTCELCGQVTKDAVMYYMVKQVLCGQCFESKYEMALEPEVGESEH